MGNRAVITASKDVEVQKSNDIGVYLHWNGGRDSVQAFLTYCKLKGYRSPETDCYGWARLCQVIGNFFGGTTSVGIEKCCNLDCNNGDNGTYIIADWEIVGRKFSDGYEQNEYDLQSMLEDIDGCMPEDEQLGLDFLRAEVVPVTEVKVGDKVFEQGVDGKFTLNEVVGIGERGRIVNGRDVSGLPYIDKWGTEDYEDNINNYLCVYGARTVRRKRK